MGEKQKKVPAKRIQLVDVVDETALRRISSERDVKSAKKKYMQLLKDELVNRLIAVVWVKVKFSMFE